MSVATLLLVGAAGAVASTVNVAAGGGAFLAYPVLVAAGLPPLAANVTNTVGSVTGSLTGAWGYRLELVGQSRRVLRLLPVCLLGAAVGVTLLLALPTSVFPRVVPWLVLTACLLVAVGPWVREHVTGGAGTRWLPLGVFVCAIYGGYFGAGNSVLVLAVVGTVVRDTMQRLNALKGVLVGVTNAAAAVLLAVLAPVAWPAASALAVGYAAGGLAGARLARRLPEGPLRAVVVATGVIVAAVLLLRQ